jgi:SAM-dependent methyltransferase
MSAVSRPEHGMDGYRPDSYGERIADVYDELFGEVTDVAANVAFLDSLPTRRPARILELAVGTGRLAIPLAAAGHDVTGIDVSAAMLEQLRAADSEQRVTAVLGDMVDDLPAGPFDLVFVAFNSLFMLADPNRQRACFEAVSRVLAAGGAFVVEAFVPWDPPRGGSHVEVRSMTVDRVVLVANLTDPATQIVTGQFVELIDGRPVRLRPYVLRWSQPGELDEWATAAGLQLAERFADVEREAFTDDSPFHVSVYRAGW